MTPSAGALAGGQTLTLLGTGFLTGATVTVGGVTCASPVVVSSTQMTCISGAHTAELAGATVTNPGGQSGSKTSSYTYQPAPTVVSGTASSGPQVGGQSVVVAGTGFLSGMTLDFGGSACASVVINSSTSASRTTSAHAAGVVTVTATNLDGQLGTLNSGYTYNPPPSITSVSLAGAVSWRAECHFVLTGFQFGLTEPWEA